MLDGLISIFLGLLLFLGMNLFFIGLGFVFTLGILLEVTVFFLVRVSWLGFLYMLLVKQMQNIPNRYRIRKYIEILKRNNKKFFFFSAFTGFLIKVLLDQILKHLFL
jgi:hypothetical protein